MDKQINQFAVKKTDGIVTQIGKSYILQPEIKFSGGSIKWYEDSTKQRENKRKEVDLFYGRNNKSCKSSGS